MGPWGPRATLMRRKPRLRGVDDRGAMSNVGALVVVALLAVGVAAATIYWGATFRAREDARVVTMTLQGEAIHATPEGQWKRLHVASAGAGLRWWDVLVELDGDLVKCAQDPGRFDSWRVVHGGLVQPCDGPRQAPDVPLLAGDVLEVWDGGADVLAPLAGRRLTLVDPERGATILTMPLR